MNQRSRLTLAPSEAAKHLDPYAKPALPLLGEIVLQFPNEIEGDFDVGAVALDRLPDDHAGIVAQARAALNACYDRRNYDQAVKHANNFMRLVIEKEAEGELDATTANILRIFGEGLFFNFEFNEVCPPG